MKLCEEDKTLRNMSMHQLNEHLSELYKALSVYSQGKYKNRRTSCQIIREIQRVKHEQTLRRKGMRTQGVWINNTTLPILKAKIYNHDLSEAEVIEIYNESSHE